MHCSTGRLQLYWPSEIWGSYDVAMTSILSSGMWHRVVWYSATKRLCTVALDDSSCTDWVKFEALMTWLWHYTVVWDVTPCRLVEIYRLLKQRIAVASIVLALFYTFCTAYSSTLMAEVVLPSETSVNVYWTIWHHFPGVNIFLLIKSATSENHINILRQLNGADSVLRVWWLLSKSKYSRLF
jgi:hypothetical protein